MQQCRSFTSPCSRGVPATPFLYCSHRYCQCIINKWKNSVFWMTAKNDYNDCGRLQSDLGWLQNDLDLVNWGWKSCSRSFWPSGDPIWPPSNHSRTYPFYWGLLVTAIRLPNSTSVLCLIAAPLNCMCMAHHNFPPLLIFPPPWPPNPTTDNWTLTLLQGSCSKHHSAKHCHLCVPATKAQRR